MFNVYIYICVTTDKHILSDLSLSSMFHTLVFWQNATGTISSHGVLDCQISCAALAESKIACSYSEELFPFDVIFFCPILPFKDVCFLHKAFQILFWPAKGIDHCSHFPALLGQCRCFIYSLACIYIYICKYFEMEYEDEIAGFVVAHKSHMKNQKQWIIFGGKNSQTIYTT